MSDSAFLLVIGEVEALGWILRNERMAFAPARRSIASRLRVGDALFLLTTRGCFHNPRRDRTRVIGRAIVMSAVVPLPSPVTIVGREFVQACDMKIHTLAPFRQGVDVAPLIPRLDAFPAKNAWAYGLRRALVPLPAKDVRLLDEQLTESAEPFERQRDVYIESIRPSRRWSRSNELGE